MNFDLKSSLIMLNVSGSQSYGLATETSDLDMKGLAIAPKKVRNSLFYRFEQSENNPIVYDFIGDSHRKIVERCGKPIESIVYSLDKFFRLCTDCNPNILELLWVHPDDVIHSTPLYDMLRLYRDLFLSKKARFTFLGYAFAQIRRIETHRKWLLNPVLSQPKRSDFDLPEQGVPQYMQAETLIRHEIDHWNFHDLQLQKEDLYEIKERIVQQLTHMSIALDVDFLSDLNIRRAACHKIGFDDNLMRILEKEYIYRRELANYNNYCTWKKNRNPERAKLEEKCGLDAKHAAHVVRLTRMGVEILEGKGVIVRRPDRDELLAIRNGDITYEKLMDYTRSVEKRIDELYKTSSLQHAPDRDKIEALYDAILEKFDAQVS